MINKGKRHWKSVSWITTIHFRQRLFETNPSLLKIKTCFRYIWVSRWIFCFDLKEKLLNIIFSFQKCSALVFFNFPHTQSWQFVKICTMPFYSWEAMLQSRVTIGDNKTEKTSLNILRYLLETLKPTAHQTDGKNCIRSHVISGFVIRYRLLHQCCIKRARREVHYGLLRWRELVLILKLTLVPIRAEPPCLRSSLIAKLTTGGGKLTYAILILAKFANENKEKFPIFRQLKTII